MTRTIIALVLVSGALPATTQAAGTSSLAPPGNSAVDEYLETVPTAVGHTRPKPPGDGGAGAGKDDRVQGAGAGGSAPSGATGSARHARRGPAGPATNPPRRAASDAERLVTPSLESEGASSRGRSPAGELLAAIVGQRAGDGMGLALPAILLATVLGAAVLTLRRRRAAG